MIIISGSNGNKYNADVNHKNYAKQHNIEYHYFTDIDYKQGVMQHPGYLKTYAIRQALESHDRVMWIDDDAFFIDFNWDCRTVFDQYTKPWIVSQSHPVKARQAILNSGIMFYRKNLEIINMLSEIPNITDKEKLKQQLQLYYEAYLKANLNVNSKNIEKYSRSTLTKSLSTILLNIK